MAPLITNIYTADPSAHVFNGKVYIYPSHDRETDIKFNDNGDQYDMADYHVFSTSSSLDDPEAHTKVTDHGVVLRMEDVPWVSKQLWAPDAAYNPKTNKYHLFFPARDKKGIFRIGTAIGDAPEGPFAPEKDYIRGSYSIDPAVLVDDDQAGWLYFGGLWGGQLQCYQKGHGDEAFDEAWGGSREVSGAGARAQGPRVARLSEDFRSIVGGVREVEILDPDTGEGIPADDHGRRFFEAAWTHRRAGVYYLSYSTGDTHYLCYATGSSPVGPFTYGGRILEPVLGWTTHHSIVEFRGRWWLFYHDCELSGGVDHLRSVKVKEIFYDREGRIVTEKPE